MCVCGLTHTARSHGAGKILMLPIKIESYFMCVCELTHTARTHGAGKIFMLPIKIESYCMCVWAHRIVEFVLILQRYVQIVSFQFFLRAEITYFIYELESQILYPHFPRNLFLTTCNKKERKRRISK